MEQEELLKQWIHTYYDRLTYIAFTYLHDQNMAEDLVQQSFINAYLSLAQLKEPNRPYPWLVRIVINLCHNVTRKTRREQPVEFLPEQRSMSAEDVYMQKTRNKEVYITVISLPEKLRTPIILYYFEELSIREIAEALSLSEGAVKTRLSRGRDQLKNKLRGVDAGGFGVTFTSS
ncbi:RNA polymerase sigma factor [Paenibacillus sp. MMO-177]|uniref:RNA polymerase sigma factor n=1 Tax=Paenibacillus sp. MMO-177 TaxID=3081289 RepID=UPI0030198696